MKTFSLLVALAFYSCFAPVWAQQNWVKLTTAVSLDEAMAQPSNLGVPQGSTLELVRVQEDELGMRHFRYSQTIDGVPVEGAQLIVHEKNGNVVSANGRLVSGVSSSSPVITSEEAITNALLHVDAERYAWESPTAENMLSRITNDPGSTYYPRPELVYFDPMFSQSGEDYRLAFKLDVFSLEPKRREHIYVDALAGSILGSLSQIHTDSSTGTAVTRYSGSHPIVTDSISPSYFRLRDYSRGSGIETYNMRTYESSFIPDSAVDFIDFDNLWDNANAEQDEVAGDVHWGAEMTFDYYLQKHNRYSYDDNGKLIVSYVHVDDNWFNARFVGDWMEYGDGSGNPLTSIDVVSHEMTHGVVGTTAGLIYAYESGAMNESFCDIFGTAVEFFAIPDSADWEIGEANFTLRSMSNPNQYGDPDTYKGANWAIGPSDNGGVHTNSGVQNFWFYLLTNGGSGTNDKGNAYNLNGVGLDSAAQIAYRSLAFYLTPTSGYSDARQGSIQAAEDLYGPCSWEVMEVARAWYAVGVGSDSLTRDFSMVGLLTPETSCDLTSSEQVSVQIIYHESGCGDYVEMNENVQVSYAVNGGIPVTESLVLTDTLFGGDTIIHVFGQTADLSNYGTYTIDAWVDFFDDAHAYNDTAESIQIVHPYRISNSPITFEDQTAVVDSFYTVTNRRSFVGMTPLAANLSSIGLRMTGDNPDRDRSFQVPPTQADIWTQNPNYFAQTCLCADATNWSTAYLKFELKQTFSKWYKEEYGFDLPLLASTMRVSVNGTPVTNDFHPVTYWSDPYFSRTIDLNAYAGSQFEVCFETMNFVKQEDDPVFGSKGDNAYIDNIWVSDQFITGVEEEVMPSFSLYPNPAGSHITIDCNLENYTYRVLDISGREVIREQDVFGIHRVETSGFERGTYLVQVITPEGLQSSRPLILQ